MDILFYTILFIVGVIVGCFWGSLAIEIPESINMKKTHYSNNKHEGVISKLAYMMIGGISSIILVDTLNINLHEFDFSNPIIYVFAMIYISTLVLIAGIDKNYSKIEKGLLGFGIISSIIYMVYLCMIDLASIHLNAIYLAIYMILLIIDAFLLRKYARDSYIVNILMLIILILTFTDLKTLTYTLTMALIAIILYTIMLKHQKKKNGNKKLKIKEIPVGYFITASNIIVLFMIRLFENHCI